MPTHETAIILATVIAAVSAMVAVIGAVIASRSARAFMKSAFASTVSAQKKYGRMLPPPITITVSKRIDWARYAIGVIDTPFATVLTILFSIALGVGLNLLLSRSDTPRALASKPAVQATTAAISAPPAPTPVSAAPPRTAPISAPPAPTPVSATPPRAVPILAPPAATAISSSDHNEAAALLARGLASLSHGDVALARVFLRRAAERDDPDAALTLGGTYDPAGLRRLGIHNLQAQADPAKAREWYRRAADLGSAAAVSRLDQLSKTDQ